MSVCSLLCIVFIRKPKVSHQVYIPSIVIATLLMYTSLKYFDRSSSSSQIVSFKLLFIPAAAIQIISVLSIQQTNIFVTQLFKTQFKFPLKTVTSVIAYVYFAFIVLINILDEETSKEMQMLMSQYYFQIYIKRRKSFYNDYLNVTGNQNSEGSADAFVKDILERSYVHVCILVVGNALIVAVSCFYIISQFVQFTKYVITVRSENFNHKQVNNTKNPKSFFTRPQLLKQIYIICLILTHYGLFVSFWFSSGSTFRMIAPAQWNLYKSQKTPKLKANEYKQFVDNFRTQNQLKSNEDWLDQRNVPEFPTVYAEKSIVCSYNPNIEYCQQQLNEYTSPQDAPNVVLVVVESFSPGPMMLENNVVQSQTSIVDGPLYKQQFLPHLRSLSESGVSFASLSSNGLPTVFGWHSLMTGEIPYSNSINMAQSVFNDVDDFPSYFKQQGYHTMYVSPSSFKFDGKHNWLFRGREVLDSEEQLNHMPLWFDDVYQYFPNETQLNELNLEASQYQTWIPDRITASQFISHFEQAKTNQSAPVLGVWATVDTHMPFSGQDDNKFYEQFKFGEGISGFGSNKRVDRYSTVVKYTDHYIGQVVDFLRNNYNNTVVVVLGDHGAREVPSYRNSTVDKMDPFSALYDDSCNDLPFSNDQQFTTSAVISYLGDDSYIKQLFEPIYQKVVKVPTDHQDMIRTLYDIVEQSTGKHLASSRNGRNLFELTQNLMSNTLLRSHWSLRSTHLHSELATQDTIYRFHSLGARGQVFSGIYPTCVTNESRDNISKLQFKQFSNYQKFFDYLQRNNKQFNYQFRNESCVYPTVCRFPNSHQSYNENMPKSIICSVIIFGVCLGVFLYVCLLLWKTIVVYVDDVINRSNRLKTQQFRQKLKPLMLLYENNPVTPVSQSSSPEP
ncbi:Sulfatase [Hexamita inflata]|uniref:Sulfatase n=1 Tax=Hexamita inflata TaxID=28002 RepID=A0AA86QCL5_9EUKA|nr:Sulfatase [Hexamita inflata]